MKPNNIVVVLGLLSLTGLSVAQWNQGQWGQGQWGRAETHRLRVESRDGRRQYHAVSNSSVRLIKRLSDKPCVEGRTWDADRNGIWVDRGCRAEFEVRTTGRPAPSSRTVHFRLESRKDRREYKSIANSYVRLVKRLSDAPCEEGRSWGYDRSGVWVSRGCRAEFEVTTDYRRPGPPRPMPRPGWPGNRPGYGHGNGRP